MARRLAAHEGRPDRVGVTLEPTEFIVLLESVDALRGPFGLSASSSRSCAASFDYAGVSFQLEIRAGVVVFPTDGGHAAELLQRADLALYRAEGDRSHRRRLSQG